MDVAHLDHATLSRVVEAVRGALKANSRLRYVPLQALLEQPRGSFKRIDQAIDLVERAQEHLTNLESAKAIERLEKAVELFEYSFLGLIRIKPRTKPLADALRLLATAYFQDGQAKKAQETLQRLLVLEPKTAFDPKLFPQAMAQLVDDERLMFDEFGSSTVEITTEPPGARVYLNARRVGRSPMEAQGVRRGFHYLTARLPGYRTTTMGLEVDPPKLAKITIKLRRFKRDPVPDMARAFLEMGQPRPGPGLTALAARLNVDMIVIGKASPDQDLGLISLHLYDFRLKTLLKGPVSTKVSQDFPKDKVDEALRMLFADVPLDGKRPEQAPVVEKPARRSFPETWASFRRSKGFWPTVGVVAGVVVTGVVVGLAVGLQPRGDLEPRGWRHVVLGHTVRF